MSNFGAEGLIDGLGAHQQESYVGLRRHNRFMCCWSLNHMLACTVSLNNNHTCVTFCEKFVGLAWLQGTYFSRSNHLARYGDTLVLLPGSLHHFDQNRSFSGDNKGICFSWPGEIDVGGSGGNHTLMLLCQFAGKSIHGSSLTACSHQLNEGQCRQRDELR